MTFNSFILDGEAVFTWPLGDKLTSRFKDGVEIGVGTYSWPSGASFTGEWDGQAWNGFGIHVLPSGFIKRYHSPSSYYRWYLLFKSILNEKSETTKKG